MHTVNKIMKEYSADRFLHYKYAERIVLEATKVFKKDKSINVIKMVNKGKVTIVGDLLGQFHDLKKILRLREPSLTDTLIFNGNMVNRGNQGVQVLLTIYALKIAFPNNVFVHRGSHEQLVMNKCYGFLQQVVSIYDMNFFQLVQKSFDWLSHGSVINKKALVVPSGIPRITDVTINDLTSLNLRGKPLVYPTVTRHEIIASDLLWSEFGDSKLISYGSKRTPLPSAAPKSPLNVPKSMATALANSTKLEQRNTTTTSATLKFRFDMEDAAQFMKTNDLKVLVISHSVNDHGFRKLSEERSPYVYSVFSASCLLDTIWNKGAVITFEQNESGAVEWGSPKVRTWPDNINKSQYLTKCQTATISLVKEVLYKHRAKFYTELERKYRYSSIIRSDLIKLLYHVIQNQQINWNNIIDHLNIDTDNKGNYKFREYLDRFQIGSKKQCMKQWEAEVISHICQQVNSQHKTLEQSFASLDINGDGKVDLDEFVTAMKAQNMGLTKQQYYDLFSSLDVHNNGSIEIKDFKARFGSAYACAVKDQGWIRQTMLELSREMITQFGTLKKAFLVFDSQDESHLITYRKWSHTLKKYFNGEVRWSPSQRREMFLFIDVDNNGNISYVEFKRALGVFAGTPTLQWEHIMIQRICDAIRSSRDYLGYLFITLDNDSSGTIEPDEFRVGLESLSELLGKPLTEDQVQSLCNFVDKDKDGKIAFKEFLDAFELTQN
eukprot:TRINITY_DN6032_c0_g1_i4.p1 TRINITY_DN6032_c0_g1~~TRINITY_DN6032_c0_g1_i4.p1  ORF type:complete len:806 (+),score=109.31 TRINITY_DN6032_c0_g1_i4:258-2420(+)